MAFIKHVGKHSDKKVVVVFREVPGQEHMALVVYTDTLVSSIHDTLINVLESNMGQTADHLGEALDRSTLPDGRNVLHALHEEGLLKKVQTSQVILTPTAKSAARLDEINSIIRDQKVGNDAAKRAAQLDESAGLVDPTAKNRPVENSGALDDASIATDLIAQSQRMAAEAKGLEAESARLLQEAYELNPSLNPNAGKAKKSTTAKVTVDLPSMSKNELLTYAKANGIPSNASMNKAAILEAINSK